MKTLETKYSLAFRGIEYLRYIFQKKVRSVIFEDALCCTRGSATVTIIAQKMVIRQILVKTHYLVRFRGTKYTSKLFDFQLLICSRADVSSSVRHLMVRKKWVRNF